MARNRYLFSAFYKPTSLLTVHAVDVETAPLFVHKLMLGSDHVLLTDRLIYVVDDQGGVVSVVSAQLSECRMEGDAKFNPDALVAQFTVQGEKVLRVFKLADLTGGRHRKSRDEQKKDKSFVIPKTIDEVNVLKPKIDTCVVVTTNAVYKIVVRCSPVKKFVQCVTEENDLEKAEKVSLIFGLNVQQLLEVCGDLMISKGSFHSGIILYKQAKVHLLKRVLKLAITADCRTLLKFVHLCLSASRVDMSTATKIHIGNLAVMAYTELILRHGGSQRVSNTRDFMNFLRYEEFYDQILAVNVACQAGHWTIVTILAKCRGLQPEVVSAFGQILQSARAPRANDKDFLLALSDPSLTQSLLVCTQSSKEIFAFVRSNVDAFPVDILERFAVQLDPSQPCVIPLVNRLFHTNKYSSSLDTTIESVDFDNPDKTDLVVKELIETFLVVLISLVAKNNKEGYNIKLLDKIEPPDVPEETCTIEKMPFLQQLSCGYEHAAIVRNSTLYMTGVSSAGCLGLGPLLTPSSPPKLVQTLSDLKVKVMSVSCGRKHTLALTDYGVYAWGSNAYGQLGLGPFIHETPYPQMTPLLSFKKMIQVSTGQYHSLALTSSGQVYTWGWGIHGQLGHGNCENSYYPKLLDFKEQVVQVAAGHAHSLILTNDGRLFGFGSNVFGQLESCQLDSNKATRPVRVMVMPDMYVPIARVTTSYFHNVAVRADDEVYTWGASPQEVRLLQSKNLQKQNGMCLRAPDSWKQSVHVYSGGGQKPIDQVAVGYRHSVILHNGKLLWGRNKDDELSPPKLKDKDNISYFTHRFLHVGCGLDYTMAVDQAGKLLAWGSPSMAQTVLGRPLDESSANDGKVIIFKNTRRVVKFPNNFNGNTDSFPVEVPGLPTMAITFNPTDHRLVFTKKYIPYAVLQVENDDDFEQIVKPLTKSCSPLSVIQNIPKFKFGQKTLHYALEAYHGFYDAESILSSCLDVNNHQAASKIAMLDGHFGDSLGFQLTAFKKYMDSCDLDLDSIFVNKEIYDNIKEKDHDLVNFVVKNIQDDFGQKTYINSPADMLSASSSLDSIRQWGDDLEHQGGCESPCEVSDAGDMRNYPLTSVSQRVSDLGSATNKKSQETDFIELEIRDKETKEIIDDASKLVQFYIQKIYTSENHILMQNVLMKCIEFWLTNDLPVPILENVLLKNMDKYFYPLSILLFCKNFTNEEDEDIVKDDRRHSAGFLKEFSTKFCLHLCSMVLENVNKA